MKRTFPSVTFGLALAACARAESPPPSAGQVYVVQNGLGSGEVRVGLAKDGCGLDCPELYGRGAAARLVAKPAPGSLFDGFSGPCTGRMPCVVPLDKPRWVGASFRDAAARWVSDLGQGHVSAVVLALDAGGGLAIASASDVWLARYDRDGKKSWEMQDVDRGPTKAHAVAFDAAGDIVVGGGNDRGAFVEKRNAAGAPVWKNVFAGGRATDVAVDGNGDVLVCGTFSSEMKVGKTRLESAGGVDVFVLRISGEGKLVDAARLGGKDDDRAPHIATDGITSIFVGYTTANADANGEVANGDAHLVRYAALGRVEWEKTIGGRARIDAMSATKRGDVVLAGRFESAVDVFGKSLQSKGASDVLVASVDAAGAASWARSFGGKDQDEAAAVDVDEGGRVAWLGTFQHEMKVGEKNLVCKQYPQVWQGGSAFVSKGVDVALGVLSAEGEVLNARAFGGSGTDFSRAIAWAPGGDVVILVDQEVLLTHPNGGIGSMLERTLMRRPALEP